MITTPSGPRIVRDGRAFVTGQLTDWGYAAGWRAIRAMPEVLARNTFDAGARYAALGGGPDQLRKNLARVIGVPPAQVPASLMRASLSSYARYWREAFRLPSMDHQKLFPRLDRGVRGKENVAGGFDAGRGVILALPHSGNWDTAGVWFVQAHGTFTTVAERLKPESLYRRFLEYRESLGFEVLPLTGSTGGTGPYGVLADRLRANRAIALMAERDLTRTGVPVDFFGEATRMPAGPARLALETGAALLPTHSRYEKGEWVVRFHPPMDTSSGDVGVITQALADLFAEEIAAFPADWHMLQPQWLADLPEERRARLSQPGDNP